MPASLKVRLLNNLQNLERGSLLGYLVIVSLETEYFGVVRDVRIEKLIYDVFSSRSSMTKPTRWGFLANVFLLCLFGIIAIL